jgi:hypothetical protein
LHDKNECRRRLALGDGSNDARHLGKFCTAATQTLRSSQGQQTSLSKALEIGVRERPGSIELCGARSEFRCEQFSFRNQREGRFILHLLLKNTVRWAAAFRSDSSHR